MKIIINGKTYEDSGWSGSAITFRTQSGLDEIEQDFKPGENATIQIFDGGTEVARYINKGISSLRVNGGSPRTVTVEFDLTQISQNAETEIRESLDNSDGAIVELAEMVAGLADADIAGLYNEIKEYFTRRMREEDQIFYNFDIRIRALEADAGIVSIEKNEDKGE